MIIYGGTGQCKLVASIVGAEITAIFDDTLGLKSPIKGISIYSDWEKFISDLHDEFFCVAIGNPANRMKLARKFQALGMYETDVVHHSVWLPGTSAYGGGVQIMAGVVIGPDVDIGSQVIINANASIDHDCIIGDGCEVGPGATLCGEVTMKHHAWVGAGAVVLPRLTIGAHSIVGAGAVVTKDVPDNVTVVGNPARIYEQ